MTRFGVASTDEGGTRHGSRRSPAVLSNRRPRIRHRRRPASRRVRRCGRRSRRSDGEAERRRRGPDAHAIRRAAESVGRGDGLRSRLLFARRHRRPTRGRVRARAWKRARHLHAHRHARQSHGGASARRRIEPRHRPGGEPLLSGRRRLRADAQRADAHPARAWPRDVQ